jgi:HEAT repeat protein
MTATLGQLVRIRSIYAEEVMAFLRHLAEALDATPWVRKGGTRIRASDIAVELFVLTKATRGEDRRRRREGEGEARVGEPRSPMEEIEAERYELPGRIEGREERRWRQVCRPGRRRLALRGAPGGGKTFITRHTLAEWARRAAARIDDRQVGLDEVDAPIWVTAKALAQAVGDELATTLLGALRNSLPPLEPSPRVEEWYRSAVGTARASVVVDALDELQADDRAAFEARARQLDGLPGLVLVTCRTMHWEDRKGWLGWPNLVELELAPLKRRQQREFGRKFLALDPALAAGMEHLLNVNFALRHACTTPLLLSFACLLHQDGLLGADTTHAILYSHMLRRMLSGEWRGVTLSWAGQTRLAQDFRQFFEKIGWGLFQAAPQLNRFTLDGWTAAAQRAIPEAKSPPIAPGPFLDELEKAGLLVPAGFDDLGDQCWSVVHRTFLEFLVARVLSRMDTQAWLTEAKQHFWFQPEWLEVLTFLAGLVGDATPLIDAVAREQEEDDVFGSMLHLKARLVGAARKVDQEAVERTCDQVVSFWKETLIAPLHAFRPILAEAMFAALGANHAAAEAAVERLVESIPATEAEAQSAARVLGALGTDRAIHALVELIGHPGACWTAAGALGAMGSERAVDPLLALTRNRDFTFLAAVGALGALGVERAVDRLIELMRVTTRPHYHIVRALGAAGADRAVDSLLELLIDVVTTGPPSSDLLWEAARALKALGADPALNPLLELTGNPNADIRMSAARALGTLATDRGLGPLLVLTRDPDAGVRGDAARALGELGADRAVDVLLELTRDFYAWVRAGAAEALGALGAERAVDALLRLTHDLVYDVRERAVRALGALGTPCAVQRLVELLHDPELRGRAGWALGVTATAWDVDSLLALTNDVDADVRRVVAGVLGLIGADRVVDSLLALTRDANASVRWVAAEALGAIGATRAVDPLLRLLGDAHVCRAAAEALGALGDERAVEPLLARLGDEDGDVRGAAAAALWKVSWKNKLPIRVPRRPHKGNPSAISRQLRTSRTRG